NIPDFETFEQMYQSAQMLEEVRALLKDCPLEINSAYRSPELNQRTGGAPRSTHMSGYVADIRCPSFGSSYEIAKAIGASPVMQKIDQLTLEYGQWVHISFDPRSRKQTLTLYRKPSSPGSFTEQSLKPIDNDGNLIETAPATGGTAP